MNDDSSHPHVNADVLQQGHVAPGDEQNDFEAVSGIRSYLIGQLHAAR